MKFTKLLTAAITLGLVVGVSSNANAGPLGLNDPGVVGIVNGQPSNSNPTTDAGYAQALLNLAENTTSGFYQTSATDYNGTILGLGWKTETPNNFWATGQVVVTVPAGYVYALAKYDGDNAGYVLFHLPTFGNSLPRYPYALWTTNESQYQMSHFTVYNQVSVPDGGSMAMLLGAALLGLGVVRRMAK